MDQLPVRFSPAELARAGHTSKITLPVSHFTRFVAILAEDVGDVTIQAKFEHSEDGLIVATGDHACKVSLICQRCLQPVPTELSSKFSLVFIRQESEAADLPDELDPVLIGDDGEIHVVDFIEDELILQLPTRVVHEKESDCDPAVIAAVTGSQNEPEKTHSPFAGLQDLLKK